MDRRRVIMYLVTCLTLVSCTRIPTEVEMRDLTPIDARSIGPDGSIEAVMTHRGYGGGPGSEAYLVYMHAVGSNRAYLVLTGLYLKDIRFNWQSNAILDGSSPPRRGAR